MTASHLISEAALNIALPDSPLLAEYLRNAELPDLDRERLERFARDGYLIIDLGLPGFDELAATIIRDLAPHYPETDRRIDEAWYFDEGVRDLAANTQLLGILEGLYLRRPIPFQTLNFDAGTEQAAHSDTIHFHCIPRHYMCGVWIALEDVDENNGRLFVYPGSHRLPDFDMYELGLPSSHTAYAGYEEQIGRILRESGYERVELSLKAGQAVVWAANLFHGGSPIREAGRTRHSQVTHYYFEGGMYYLPLASDLQAGKICLREVLDIARKEFVPHFFRGKEVLLSRARNVLKYPRPLPPGISAPRDFGSLPARLYHGISKTLEYITDKRRDIR